MPPPAPRQRPVYVVRGGEGEVTVTFLYRDCGCSAKWSADELIVRPCEEHAAGWLTELHEMGYAGPPTFNPPIRRGLPRYGDN